MNVGRNDPCPCGSGKKYKKCCCLEPKGGVAHGGLQDLTAEIREKLENTEFNSLDEAQSALNQLMAQSNREPVTDFHGLSPQQMSQIINSPYDSPDLVRFHDGGKWADKAPVIRLFSLFVDAIGEKGLKVTATGNLPPVFCRNAALVLWGEERYERRLSIQKIRTEVDFFEMHILRIVAQQAGLIRNYKGKVVLIKKWREKIQAQGVEVVYPVLFKAYVQKFNWAYLDGFDELHFIQRSFLFTFYLLHKYGGELRGLSFYGDILIKAFPQLLEEVSLREYRSQEEGIQLPYFNRTFKHFASFFGLVSYKSQAASLLDRKYEVQKTGLLDQFLSFHV